MHTREFTFYTYTYMYANTHIFRYTWVYEHIHLFMYRVYMHGCLHTHAIYAYSPLLQSHTCIHTYTGTYTCTFTLMHRATKIPAKRETCMLS